MGKGRDGGSGKMGKGEKGWEMSRKEGKMGRVGEEGFEIVRKEGDRT